MEPITNTLPNYTEEVIEWRCGRRSTLMDEVVVIRIRRNGEEVGHLVRHFRHTVGSLASPGYIVKSVLCTSKAQALELAQATAEEVFGDSQGEPLLLYAENLGGAERADRLQAIYRKHGRFSDNDVDDPSDFNSAALEAGFSREELRAFYSRSH